MVDICASTITVEEVMVTTECVSDKGRCAGTNEAVEGSHISCLKSRVIPKV